jgi:uncharacterized protein (TIGR03000 family)
MNRLTSFIFSGALAVATLVATGPAANAQHRGGMSGGAYHGGGGYHGGGYGGYRGGYGGYGGYGRGYGYGYGYGYPGVGLYLGLGGLGYGGYGNYYGGGYGNYYGGDGYAPGYYNYAQPQYVVPNYGAGYNGPVQTQSAYQPSADSARIVIRTPADAQVWIDNYQSTQTGPVRELTTPAGLEPGKTYHYTVKAQWNDNGKPVVQEKKVDFQVGQTAVVDFTQPNA